MEKRENWNSIEEVKEQVINTSLVVASMVGSVAYLASFISKFLNNNFNISTAFDTFVLLSLLLITIRRKRISNSIKAYIMVSLILFLSLTDAFFYGLLSSTRVYLVLVPLYSIIYFPFIRSLLVYSIALAGFIIIGFHHSKGILYLPQGYEPSEYMLKLYPWIINTIHISAVGLVILYITRKFFLAFSNLIDHLETKNRMISENERSYREIFNSTNEAIFLHNSSDGQILDVNEVMLRMYGFHSKEEALEHKVKDISAKSDEETQQRAQTLIKKAVEEGPQIFEWESKKITGEIFYSEISLKNTDIGGKGRVLAVVRDITERKLLEQKIVENEQRYRTLVETSQEGISMMDMNGIMLFVNSRKAQLIGAKESTELIGQNAFNLLTSKSISDVKSRMPELLEKGYIENFEAEVRRMNGSTFMAEFNVTVLTDPNGRPQYLMDTMRDITARKLAENALKESEEKYRTLMESLNEVIIVADNNHTIQYVNKRFTEKLGYTPEEIIGKVGYKMLHDPEDLEKVEEANKLRINQKSSNYELKFKAKDGSKIDFLVSGAPYKNSDGVTIGSIGAMIDLTETNKVKKELLESQQLFQTLSQMSPVGIFRTDSKGNFTYTNPRWSELSGLNESEAFGYGWINAIHPEDREVVRRKWTTSINESTRFSAEYRYLKKDGSETWVISIAVPELLNNELKGFIGTNTNVTKRTLAEKALKQSEEKYRTLMENVNEVIMMVDNNDKVLFVNKRFTEKLGYTPEEIIGKTGYNVLVKPKNQDLIINENKKRVEGKNSQYEITFTSKSGKDIEFLVNGAPVLDERGKTIASIGAMIDITEINMAKRELQESERRYRNLFENAQVGIYQTTPDGRILKANPALISMLGYDSFEDLTKLNLETSDAIIDVPRILFKEMIERDGYVKDFENKWRAKNGDTIYVVENARAVKDEKGNTLYYDGFATNVTDRKLAEIALKESEERYKTIIDAFPEIILISDLQSNILFGNKVLERVTGITQADYFNPNRKPHIHPEDLHFVKDAIKKLISSEDKHTPIIENRFIDAWGNLHWFSGIISKVYYNNKLCLQTISRDVTEKKKVEQELEGYRNHLEFLVKERTEEIETANEELRSTNEELYNQREELETILNKLQSAQDQLVQSEKMASLGILAAGVAHEINNPLNFIQGGIGAIENYFKENLKERIGEVSAYIEVINIGVKRAADIVTSLNHYSRKNETVSTSCNIHTIIDNCLKMLHNQLKDRISVVKEYSTSSFNLVCNEGKMHQVILNILSNALQSIEKKGSITVNTKLIRNKLRIEITDTGCGMSKETMSKITDPFFTTKEPGKGTGLGLSITQNIIIEHKGTLKFESKEGEGTKVTITLPLNS